MNSSTAPAATTISPITAVGPSGPGALAGYEATCSCGLTMKSSMLSSVQLDVQAHIRWHHSQRPGSRINRKAGSK